MLYLIPGTWGFIDTYGEVINRAPAVYQYKYHCEYGMHGLGLVHVSSRRHEKHSLNNFFPAQMRQDSLTGLRTRFPYSPYTAPHLACADGAANLLNSTYVSRVHSCVGVCRSDNRTYLPYKPAYS